MEPSAQGTPSCHCPLTVIFFSLFKIFILLKISQNRKQRTILYPSLSFSSSCHENQECQAVQGMSKKNTEEHHQAWGTGTGEHHEVHLKKRKVFSGLTSSDSQTGNLPSVEQLCRRGFEGPG